MTFRFAEPWFLALAPAILLWWLASRGRQQTLPFSSAQLLDLPNVRSLRQRVSWLPGALRLLWLMLLVVALAGPQMPELASARRGPGLALELVVDVSGSMAARDSIDAEGPRTRLDLVKSFMRNFVGPQSGGLRGNDWIGLIAFSKSPRVICPLTSDHLALLELLDELGVDLLENRTNIGDAMALAIDKLREAPSGPRVIILCSDGAHNVPSGLSPGSAARIAETLGIRIHVVGVGRGLTQSSGEGDERDEQALRAIARIGGGSYVSASGDQGPGQIADMLSELEPSLTTVEEYRRWRDLYPGVLLAALGVWTLEALVGATWLRVIP